MQIVNNNSGNAALEQTSRAAETQATSSSAKGAGAQAPASQADGLQLSKFAGTLSHVLQTDSTSRSQRVAQLTAAVQSGTYKVDANAVSRAMVDHSIAATSSLK